MQSCERGKQRAGGPQAPHCCLVTVHAQKAAGDPRMGDLVNAGGQEWASRTCRSITHTGALRRCGQAPHRVRGERRSMAITTGERFRQCLRRNLLTMRTVKHQLAREVVWSPSLALLPAGGWSRDPGVPSNLNDPLIFQHPGQEGQKEP